MFLMQQDGSILNEQQMTCLSNGPHAKQLLTKFTTSVMDTQAVTSVCTARQPPRAPYPCPPPAGQRVHQSFVRAEVSNTKVLQMLPGIPGGGIMGLGGIPPGNPGGGAKPGGRI